MKPDILLPIHTYPDGNAENISFHVASIAQHLDATVHALIMNADFPHISSALGSVLLDVPALVGGAKARCRERGIALSKAVEAATSVRNITLRTTQTECFPGDTGNVVSQIARYHDLALIGIGADEVGPQATAEAVLFNSGKPTLLVPEDTQCASLEHVMIAWDGSRVAARAVADARDFLMRAKIVTIVCVTDEKVLPDDEPGKRLAEHLSRHGITSTVATALARGRPISEALQEHAFEIGAGILVMGGFGHSRVRDFVLGGATSGILKKLLLPVLLSH